MSARLYLLVNALFFCAGEASAGRPVEIVTSAGDTALLPCHIDHSPDRDPPLVEWSKEGLNPNISFLYRVGCETFEAKNPVFHYRTSLIMDQVKNGNLSLRISDVRLSDAGKYICRSKLNSWREVATIELVVVAVSEPKLSMVAVEGGGVTLQCEVSCWFPEPQMMFLDSQGNDIIAKDPKSNLDSVKGCFTITRRLTVQTADRFSCRVHQRDTKQTRSTEIHIPDDCVRSCMGWVIAVITTIICACACALAIFLWKKYDNSVGGHKILSQQSSLQSPPCSPAGGFNPSNPANSVQNATVDYQRKIQELTSSLRVKDEDIRRLTEDLHNLRSTQEPVMPRGQPTVDNSPSESSPVNLPPDQSPHEIDPKPAASSKLSRSRSVSLPQSKDSKPSGSIQSHSEGTNVVRSKSVSGSRMHLAMSQHAPLISPRRGNRFSPLANCTEEDLEPLT